MKKRLIASLLACLIIGLWAWPLSKAQAAGGNSVTVSIRGGGFSPASAKVKVGDTVTWVNQDDHDHQVAADNGLFRSPNLSSGGSFRYTFKNAGTVSYSCTYHPRERGAIVVQNN